MPYTPAIIQIAFKQYGNNKNAYNILQVHIFARNVPSILVSYFIIIIIIE